MRVTIRPESPNEAPQPTHLMTWQEVHERAGSLSLRLRPGQKVFGVPRGGSYVAAALGNAVSQPEEADVFVDDIIDSGRTRAAFAARFPGKPFLALVDKQASRHDATLGWVVFPWEVDRDNRVESGPEDAVRRILQFIGEDPEREGLAETPARVLKAWKELTSGYAQDPSAILSKTFAGAGYQEMVVLRGIGFHSTCEHHLLPFSGTATVAYIPKERVVGLSKLARLVDCFSRRLQLQEQLTQQLVTALQKELQPHGAAAQVRASHSCMTCRGVQKGGAEMVTTALTGAFLDRPETRAEFLAACRG